MTKKMKSPPRLLTPEQIQTYLRDGILVVDNLLSPDQVIEAQRGLAVTLNREYNVDVRDLETTGCGLMGASSTNGAGGVLDIFYPEWKMKIATNETLFRMTCQLWEEAYCHEGESLQDLLDSSLSLNNEGFGDLRFKWHPYGAFDVDKGFMYIDRVGYRIPTSLAEKIGKQLMQNHTASQSHQPNQTQSAPKQSKKSKKARPIQRSLTPHFDCCPETYHDATNKNKWRPIQCFVSLTDNLHPNTGGFEAAPGFHREFQAWVDNKRLLSLQYSEEQQTEKESHPRPCVGEYTHLSPSHDRFLLQRVQHIPVRAGSVVFWDNRIPHGNSYRNDPIPTTNNNQGDGNNTSLGSSLDSALLGAGARAVVYCSFLPDVQINREFVKRQLEDWKRGRDPRVGDRWIKQEEKDSDNDSLKGDKESKPSELDEARDRVQLYAEQVLSDFAKKLMGIESW